MSDEDDLIKDRRGLEAYNLEAEASLLGAALIDNDVIASYCSSLRPDDFYAPVHARIYNAVLQKVSAGESVTPVTLKPMFEGDEELEQLGGIAYLAQLTSDGSGLLAPRELAAQVRELAQVREIVRGVSGLTELYFNHEGGNLEEAIGPIEEALAKVGENANTARPHSAGDMLRRVPERAARLTKDALSGNLGVRTSTVSDFNSLLSPIDPGTYIVIGGRPSMGKTTLASSSAWGFAANGHPTLYAAAEGTEDSLAMRLAADLSFDTKMPLDIGRIRKDTLDHEERKHFDHLIGIADTLPIDYQLVGRCDIRRLRAHVTRSIQKWKEAGKPLEIVVVDYMQLLTASENGREITDDRRRINAVSAGLLGIAQDFGLTVIALSQLSRSLEQREDKRPRLSDLRESGRIEEDADVVMFVYRDEYYLEREKPTPGQRDFDDAMLQWESDLSRARNRVDLILGKNRHGEARTRTAKFFGKHSAVRGGDFDEAAPPGFDFSEGSLEQ